MMRYLYRLGMCLFVLSGSLNVRAQAIVIENFSSVDVGWKNAWRFRAGDSTGWASPAYDHGHWQKISPRIRITENTKLWQAGHGWFRRIIQLQRPEQDELVMTFRQFGASEVYLDGKRLATLKPALFDSGGSQRLVAFVPLPISDTSRHTLAIHYTFRRDSIIGNSVNKMPFQVSFQTADRAPVELISNQTQSAAMEYLLTGIFGVLSLLHLLFYRANRSQRVNLVLALTMLSFSLIFLIDQISSQVGTLTLDSGLLMGFWVMVNLALGLLLLSVYIYLGRRLGVVFWAISAILLFMVVYGCVLYSVINGKAWISFIVVLIEYTRVSWLARRRNPDPDSHLPWKSLRFSLYSLLAIIGINIVAQLLNGLSDTVPPSLWLVLPTAILGLMMMFSIPIGLSFSLVSDYARTYQALREQFEAVRRLSAQTLAQEQEKQHLLANQNQLLEQQVADRTAELNQSLIELRDTQTQLIQREKLASLGELTAGIAHEIQNPLNFVKNFSEVSTELVTELAQEAQSPTRDQALEAELLADLTQNLQKITHHGNRASSIVKGMLEHSRSIAGEKQLTDLNALASENCKLAYAGFQTRVPTFEAALITDFDSTLGLVPVVSQEIGRVLLNLFSNALYALHKRQQLAEPGYQPTLHIRTRRHDACIRIRIRDNGTGIPDEVLPKLFQPFFTTKPTGEGTGLGLSLSYDIITKGYGGTITVTSEEGQFTEFTISLPIGTQ